MKLTHRVKVESATRREFVLPGLGWREERAPPANEELSRSNLSAI